MKKSFFFKSLAILAMFGMSFNYGIAQDAFGGAGTISYNDTITADITGATPDGPLASCWLEGPVDGDIWYGFTATGVGVKVTTFQTAGGLTDPQVAIHEWDGAGFDPLVNLTEVGCDEDGADAFHSLATACDLTPGSVYFIQVDSWAGEPGEFQMLLEDFPADSCAAVCVADDCVGGTLTGLVDGSYCSTDILEFTYDGASLATDPNCTTELAIFYTPNTDSLTAAGGPFGDGSGAYCTSFCYPDFSGTLTIGASNYGAFNLSTPATGDWWVYGAVVVDGGPTICATTDTINFNFLPQDDPACEPCDTTLTCSAGDLIDNGPVTICPGEFATAEATGISVPGGACFGELRMNFIPDTLFPGTSGGLYPGGFSIGVTNPYSFDDDVNGIMSGNGLDSLRGRYWVQYFVQTTEGLCFGDSLEVFFLAPDDPACSGVDCSVFDTAPVDLTKSFDPVNGVQDRVQVKWFKASPQVRYSDEDAAACDLKFWPKRNLDPVTGDPLPGAIVAAPGDTINIVDMKKFQGDGVTPREIFKWPVKFRKNSDNPNARRADANIRYEWQVRCACEHGAGPESPWSDVKIFNTPDFDPETGIFTPPPGADLSHLSDAKQIASNTHKGVNIALPALSGEKSFKPVGVAPAAKKPRLVAAKSFSNEVSIKLYPNPTNDVLNIVLDSEVTSVNVKDMSGRTVIQETGNGSFLQISTATLSDGMYMVELEINGQITRKPFVVKK